MRVGVGAHGVLDDGGAVARAPPRTRTGLRNGVPPNRWPGGRPSGVPSWWRVWIARRVVQRYCVYDRVIDPLQLKDCCEMKKSLPHCATSNISKSAVLSKNQNAIIHTAENSCEFNQLVCVCRDVANLQECKTKNESVVESLVNVESI